MANSYWEMLNGYNNKSNNSVGGFVPINEDGSPNWGGSYSPSGMGDYTKYMNQEGLFGLKKGTWGDIGTGVNAVTGLASLYAGLQGLDLARDQLNFNKDQANKQYAMAKDAYDRNVTRADSIGKQMAAGSANLKAVG